MLVTDFLPAVVNHETFRSVFADPRNPTPRLPGLHNGLRLMPVEFSVAAFRFGHSMIRPEYRLNTTVERRPIFLRRTTTPRTSMTRPIWAGSVPSRATGPSTGSFSSTSSMARRPRAQRRCLTR